MFCTCVFACIFYMCEIYLCMHVQFQGNEALFEAVEHQELDVVESLLSTFSLEELDLNTPNSEGLLPLDIAIMTNNVPMAKLLLRAGAKESPHCEYTRTAIKRMQHEPHFMNHTSTDVCHMLYITIKQQWLIASIKRRQQQCDMVCDTKDQNIMSIFPTLYIVIIISIVEYLGMPRLYFIPKSKETRKKRLHLINTNMLTLFYVIFCIKNFQEHYVLFCFVFQRCCIN